MTIYIVTIDIVDIDFETLVVTVLLLRVPPAFAAKLAIAIISKPPLLLLALCFVPTVRPTTHTARYETKSLDADPLLFFHHKNSKNPREAKSDARRRTNEGTKEPPTDKKIMIRKSKRKNKDRRYRVYFEV
jgi:hypothetical protein